MNYVDRIHKLVAPLLLSLVAGTIASSCNQAVSIRSPSRRLAHAVSRIPLTNSSFSIATTSVLMGLDLEDLAHRDPKVAFDLLDKGTEHEPASQGRALAMAELAANISASAGLTASDEAIAWSRDAALLSAFCLSISADATLDAIVWPTACAIHNESVARCLRLAGSSRMAIRDDWPKRLTTAGIHLSSAVHDWMALGFDQLQPANEWTVTGITASGLHAGLGLPLIASRSLDDSKKSAVKPYGPDVAVFAATAVIHPPVTLKDWHSYPAELILMDPMVTDTVTLGGSTFPMASDRGTPLARRLAQPSFKHYEYLGIFDPTFYDARAGAYAVDPYVPGKIPVVFIHGLWSSPKVWLPMLDKLRADATIRARFQFWVVLYPSGYPLPIAAQSLRKSLRDIRQQFDPAGIDSALDHMVVVGKSTGGQTTRMLVEESGRDLWNAVFSRPLNEFQIVHPVDTDLASAFFYEPESYIRTAVFITTAHRGGNLAKQPAARLGVSLIRRNNPLLTMWNDLQAANQLDSIQPAFRKSPPSSLDGLRAGNPLLKAIDDQPVAPTVTYHSIIASLHPGLPHEAMTDGFVRYTSAHLDGAASERIVTSSHLCEANPQVIAEVQRILRAQANLPQ